MKVHAVIQGTPEWAALRLQYFTASDAAAMMGASPYLTRADLLRRKATGLVEEVDAARQALFDRGHDTEAKFRPIAEDMLDGADLSPVTGSIEIDGLKLLASFDGLTFDRVDGYEHKLFNNSLAKLIEFEGEPGPAHYWQLEHQLLVSSAQRILFVTSDGTRDCMAHCFYESKPERRAQLIAGWKQFAEDLAAYRPEPVAAAKPEGRTPENLPALHIEVSGQVRASNLASYREHALTVLGSINRELTTDQHFADAEKTVKWCEGVEQRLDAAKEHALSQTASIEQVFRTIDDVKAETRRVRLELDKLVKTRKESIRGEIVADAAVKLREHMARLGTGVGMTVPGAPVDFGGAIKGKRSIQAMRDAVDQVLADAKMAASDLANRMTLNLHTLEQHADLVHLFPDRVALVQKMPDDLQAVVANRVAEHKRKEEERQEADRVRLKNEMAMQEIQGIQQQVAIAISGRLGVRKGGTIECIRETLAETEGWTITEERFGALTASAQSVKDKVVAEIRQLLVNAEAKAAIATAATPAPAPAPVSAPAAAPTAAQPTKLNPGAAWPFPRPGDPAPVAEEKATLKIGEIAARLRFTVTADFLAELGFHAVVDKGARLYRPSQFPAICEALIQHITTVADEVPA